MNSTRIILILGIALLATACLKKPKACAELEEYYEVGREYRFTSCSENYEFITWDFGDQSGFEGEDAPHTYNKNGTPVITLTAYGRGAYRTDELKQQVKTSRRYVERFEVTGTSKHKGFTFGLGTLESYREIFRDSATGTFTDDAPFVAHMWPDEQLIIPVENANVTLYGGGVTSKSLLIQQNVNFRNVRENPTTLEGGGFVLKIYWTYAL